MSAVSIAQETKADTGRIAPVVITATRSPLSQLSLPVAVTIVTGEELRLRGVTTVADALNGLTSAYVAQSGSPGGQTSLFLRGGESKYVKVLIDGVPTNDPGGTYDFASLTTDNVERIEVVRGPASVIYGADAVTGVVHVITRRGIGAPVSEVQLSVGSMPRDRGVNGSGATSMLAVDANATVHGATAAASYSLSVGRHTTDGLYQLNNPYANNVLSGRFQFAPSARADVRVALRYNDYKFNYPTNGGGTVVDSNAYRSEDRAVLGVEMEHRPSTSQRVVLALSSSVNDGGTDDQPDNAGGNTFVSQDKTRRRGAELRYFVLPTATTSLTFGAQIEQQDQRSQFQADGPFGPFTDRFTAARRNTAYYAELVASPVSTLTATIGARADVNGQFGTFMTGRAGMSWRPLEATRIRATAGTAFREPTFLENYSTGFVTGNPDLEPERTRSFDAGVEQELLEGRLNLGVTAFVQRFENMIDYAGSSAACGFSYCNVAAARADGVESELHARLIRDVRLSLSNTTLRTRVTASGFDSFQDGEPLLRRPAHKWNAELAYRGANRLSGAVRYLLVGRRHDKDFRPFPAVGVVLPGYTRIDLGAAYDISVSERRTTTLTARVENLANAYYQNVFNFLAPRRTIALGLRAQF